MADTAEEVESLRRRDFLQSLKKWSQAVIGGVVLGALVPGSRAEAGWVNSRGSWVNGGGGGWANRGGSWVISLSFCFRPISATWRVHIASRT